MQSRWVIVGTVLFWACGGSTSGATDPGPGPADIPGEVAGDPCGPACTPDVPGTTDPGTPDTPLPPDTPVDPGPGDPGAPTMTPFEPLELGDILWVTAGRLTLRYDLAHGTFDLGREPGRDGIVGARSEVNLSVDGLGQTTSSADPGPRVGWLQAAGVDEVGDGIALTFEAQPAGKIARLSTIIALHRDTPAWTVRTVIALPTLPGVIRVEKVLPITVRGTEGGGLSLGPGTREAALLDNGGDLMFDFRADLSQVGEKEGGFSTPGYASNYSAALCTATRSCLVAGFLTVDRAFPLVATDARAAEAVDIGGQKALSLFELRCLYRPAAGLDPNRTLASELGWLDFTDQPHEALQRYARAIARVQKTQPWPVPPSSWNSWTGGGGAPGWGQDIDETRILMNLDLAAQDYLPWGMDTFAVDDGWQAEDGTWTTNAAKFPSHGGQDGMAWMAQQIRAKGFRPGIWIAPFRHDESSVLWKQHPDWFIEMDDLGAALLGSATKQHALDLSRPEVLAWVRGVFQRVHDWGYEFVKLDFGYYGMFGRSYAAEGRTGIEVYRGALKAVREVLGPGTFFLHVSATGPSMGIADSVRITLDNRAEWQDVDNPLVQGIKPTLLTAAHRYWLGNTLWVNHPDLLFFRDGTFGDDTWHFPPNEATAWALFVAIYGGVFKLGETFEFLHDRPGWLALTERLLPTLPLLPEPVDGFKLRYPEVWRVPLAGAGTSWEAWGLFNWGQNRDVETLTDLPDADRVKTLPLPAVAAAVSFAGLDVLAGTLVTQEGRALLNGPVAVAQPARSGRLVVVKPVPNDLSAPEFLATDRHWAGGAVELAALARTATSAEVQLAKLVPGRPVRAWFLARKGAAVTASSTGTTAQPVVAITAFEDADLAEVAFTPVGSTAGLTVTSGGR